MISRYLQICLIYSLFAFIIVGCKKENTTPVNYAVALKNGKPWSSKAGVDPNFVYGDSLTIIYTQDHFSGEGMAFYRVHLREMTYGLVDSIKYRDSVHINAAYFISNSHGDVTLHTLRPDKSADNYLKLENYNRQTGEMVFSFQVLFTTLYPDQANIQMEFTEGKIWVTLSP